MNEIGLTEEHSLISDPTEETNASEIFNLRCSA